MSRSPPTTFRPMHRASPASRRLSCSARNLTSWPGQERRSEAAELMCRRHGQRCTGSSSGTRRRAAHDGPLDHSKRATLAPRRRTPWIGKDLRHARRRRSTGRLGNTCRGCGTQRRGGHRTRIEHRTHPLRTGRREPSPDCSTISRTWSRTVALPRAPC